MTANVYAAFQARRLEQTITDTLETLEESIVKLRREKAWDLEASSRLQTVAIYVGTAKRLMEGEPE